MEIRVCVCFFFFFFFVWRIGRCSGPDWGGGGVSFGLEGGGGFKWRKEKKTRIQEINKASYG